MQVNTELLAAQAKFNRSIDNWSRGTYREVMREIWRMKIGVSGDGAAAIRYLVRNYFGMANRIQYKMPRHLVFVHKGVGRGWPASRVADRAAAWSAASGEGRKPKPWFNPIVEKRIQELANIAAQNNAEVAAKRLMIK